MSTTTEEKVALVTGGSSGIGEAIAKQLLREGYKVAIVGSQKDRVDRVVEEGCKLSPQAFQPLGMVLDFSDPTNGKVAVERTLEHFGRLDVLINNAGIFSLTFSADPASYSEFERIMRINLDATVSATVAAIGALKETQGQIIFISSTASAKPHGRAYAYCASKAAMTMFAKCLAIDLAPQIKINIVSPGPVVTDIGRNIPKSPGAQATQSMGSLTLDGRSGQPEEVADAVSFLISSKAKFITGHELFIDGGYLLKGASASDTLRPHVKLD